MSTTPRTDAIDKSLKGASDAQRIGVWRRNYIQLETELTTLTARLAEVERERDEALFKATANPLLNDLTVDLMWHHKSERDTLAADNERLREWIDKTGFYCAGTDCQPIADSAIKILGAWKRTETPVPASGNEHSMNIKPCDICGKTKPVNLRQTFLVCDDCTSAPVNNKPTPDTDAATHDDWSGGAEATEPEVSRKIELERNAALRDRAELKRRVEELEKERDVALAQVYSSERLLDHVGVKDRDSADEQPWSLSDRISHLIFECDKLKREGDAGNKALAYIKDRVRCDVDFDADDIVRIIEERIGRYSQSVEWFYSAAANEELGDLRAELATLKAEIVRKNTALEAALHRLEWAIRFLESNGDIEKLPWYDAKEWLKVAREHYAFGVAALSPTAPKEDGKV
jgi:hypothetical protein